VEVVRIGGDEGSGATAADALELGVAEPAPLPLVAITWTDAWFDFDQAEDEEPRGEYLVTTVGFLVRNGPRFVSVAQELLPEGDGFRAITHIPVAVVDSISTLRAETSGDVPSLVATDGVYSPDLDGTFPSNGAGRRDA
jgi:hypothetical protein